MHPTTKASQPTGRLAFIMYSYSVLLDILACAHGEDAVDNAVVDQAGTAEDEAVGDTATLAYSLAVRLRFSAAFFAARST